MEDPLNDLDHLPMPPDEPAAPAAAGVPPRLVEVSQSPSEGIPAPGLPDPLPVRENSWRKYQPVILGLLVSAMAAGTGWYLAQLKFVSSPNETAQVVRTGHVRAHPIQKHVAVQRPEPTVVKKPSKKTARRKKTPAKKSKHKPWLAK